MKIKLQRLDISLCGKLDCVRSVFGCPTLLDKDFNASAQFARHFVLPARISSVLRLGNGSLSRHSCTGSQRSSVSRHTCKTHRSQTQARHQEREVGAQGSTPGLPLLMAPAGQTHFVLRTHHGSRQGEHEDQFEVPRRALYQADQKSLIAQETREDRDGKRDQRTLNAPCNCGKHHF